MVKAILFDFWGTLVETGEWSPLKQIRVILDLRLPWPEFINKLEKVMMTKPFNSLQEMFEAVHHEFNLEVDHYNIEKLIGMWNKSWMLAKPYLETIDVLTALQKNYTLVLISNTDNISLPHVLEKYGLKKYFQKMFLSFELGLIKTDRPFLELVLKQLRLNPKDCLVVGDSLESDIAAAEQAEIKAILVDRKGTRSYGHKIKNLNELKGLLGSI
ncbi:MAG TPA: HAD family hydrolase [Candidatus Nanoarchaeia archaeon]|nr:HAD family hydrolase [Candidatus Nanoarchaeia archaeon]